MKVSAVNPILNVSDISESFSWFAQLGWSVGFEWKDEPADPRSPIEFASVTCGEHEIFLCRGAQGGRGKGANTSTFEAEGDTTLDKGVWMSIFVEDFDVVHDRCVNAGLEVTHPPTIESWGVREMHVRHPDGHVFRIGAAA